MKSIEVTLKIVDDIADKIRKTSDISIVLIGGYAVIAHGVARTTSDVDFFLYSGQIQENAKEFLKIFKQAVPGNFEIEWVEGSKMIDDPFPYDIIFLKDKSGEYPRIDFIIPRYKWEVEGIKMSEPLEDIPFPVLPKPYLIAMKLKAGGPKDNLDIIELQPLLSQEEKKKTEHLAVLIKRDKNLANLLKIEKSEGKVQGADV
ncbi:MAG: hypothetical protein QG657_5116 [Acidobacteriota bacterium]|nr:hypothetical protein [Acidobacteriota bacterium]